MTIEDAKGIIHKYGYDIETTHLDYTKALLYTEGYKAKEAELEGALIIPNGWRIASTEDSRYDEYDRLIERARVCIVTDELEIEGVGDTIDEALRNALEQIKG
jgi:hypothetical protein